MSHEKTAVYPGTFDPVTFGHLNIIRRSTLLFDKLVIGVADSCQKKTLFSLEERASMVQHEISAHGIERVIVKPFYGLLVEFLEKENIHLIVRGVRTTADFDCEMQMSSINQILKQNI